VALLHGGERRENAASDAKIDGAHVGAFLGSLEAQRDSFEVLCIHRHTLPSNLSQWTVAGLETTAPAIATAGPGKSVKLETSPEVTSPPAHGGSDCSTILMHRGKFHEEAPFCRGTGCVGSDTGVSAIRRRLPKLLLFPAGRLGRGEPERCQRLPRL